MGGPGWWVPEQAEEEMHWGETTWTWITGKNGGREAEFVGQRIPYLPKTPSIRNTVFPQPTLENQEMRDGASVSSFKELSR